MKKFFYHKSPIGILKFATENNCLLSISISDDFILQKDTPFSLRIKKQLEEYFSGKRKKFDININPQGTTFQKQVWNELIKIPYGKTKNYSDIAHNIGNINAQQAVGNACNKNPVMIIIPCHRVISKNGNIGGFAYGNSIKEKLLQLETKH